MVTASNARAMDADAMLCYVLTSAACLLSPFAGCQSIRCNGCAVRLVYLVCPYLASLELPRKSKQHHEDQEPTMVVTPVPSSART